MSAACGSTDSNSVGLWAIGACFAPTRIDGRSEPVEDRLLDPRRHLRSDAPEARGLGHGNEAPGLAHGLGHRLEVQRHHRAEVDDLRLDPAVREAPAASIALNTMWL